MSVPTPLVSCLLCTRDARHLVQMAIDSYLSQEYENRELVVVDDGPDPIADMLQGIPNLVYIALPHDAASLSEKRNIGCRAAHGEFICHMDSDDWSGPHRVTDQLTRLLLADAQLGGYSQAFWYDFVDQRASCYTGNIWGANLIYRRDYALEHPWDETVLIAEDNPFTAAALQLNAIMSSPGGQNFVATLHDGNARRQAGQTSQWPPVDLSELPEAFRKAAGLL